MTALMKSILTAILLELVKHVTIDLDNALQLKIVGVGGDFAYYGFANITLS